MDTKLQELTKSIYQEGVEKARNEGKEIVEAAQAQAKAILDEANAERARIHTATVADVEKERARIIAELSTASAHTLTKFRDELAAVVERSVLAAPLKSAFTDKDFLSTMVRSVVERWTPAGAPTDLMAQLPEKLKTDLESWFATKAKDLIDKGLTITFDGKFPEGFRIGPADGSYVVSFSEKDLSALFQAHLKTRTRELLFPVI